ncbi:hypothetical protein HPP92_009438 [Vanilla planifolia]|uniref:Uncharacterized protein n=1 Tax=Vanilla planifolia TaxID=51239 RepID=A0A835V7E9_VANPL|nr:hypothetical protein HPP92_009438 [Vanilla planifolia]
MKETIRCCISCILPCGALDVVRIVHANGRVEEIGGGRRHVLAAEVMQAYPKHVLRKPLACLPRPRLLLGLRSTPAGHPPAHR